jgi:hypothetical protein
LSQALEPDDPTVRGALEDLAKLEKAPRTTPGKGKPDKAKPDKAKPEPSKPRTGKP